MSAAARDDALARVCRALLFGNFVIGSGVMSASGTLNDIAASLQVPVALAGQLVAVGAAVICFFAPVLGGLLAGWDRRRLLCLTMLWYAVGHAACALMPNYASLLVVRALTVLAAAVFTPQAAAAIGFMAPPEKRGRSITFVFLGWSVASVAGMPMSAWVGETLGWRWAMGGVAVLSLASAAAVWRTLPDGVCPPGMSLRAWRGVFANPVLMTMVAVTALQAAGQFTVFSYFAPYLRQQLQAGPTAISLTFAWFGAWGLVGNVLLSRGIDRIGPAQGVMITLVLIGSSLLLFPLATTPAMLALILVPWGLGCFATNSAQQARLGMTAPLLAPALMALNTSAIYLGQAVGAGSGGWIIAHGGYGPLSWMGLGWLLLAVVASHWVARRTAAAGA